MLFRLGTSRFTAAEHYEAALNNYTTVSTIVLILMIVQLLHFLDFQPKLSLITRTIAAAWGDLVHFFILFIMVEITFTCLGALLFGLLGVAVLWLVFMHAFTRTDTHTLTIKHAHTHGLAVALSLSPALLFSLSYSHTQSLSNTLAYHAGHVDVQATSCSEPCSKTFRRSN